MHNFLKSYFPNYTLDFTIETNKSFDEIIQIIRSETGFIGKYRDLTTNSNEINFTGNGRSVFKRYCIKVIKSSEGLNRLDFKIHVENEKPSYLFSVIVFSLFPIIVYNMSEGLVLFLLSFIMYLPIVGVSVYLFATADKRREARVKREIANFLELFDGKFSKAKLDKV